ncbi:MAG: phenylacetate-CoA oxygenase subunit PaaJ [Verrucomicrobia bacterium]|nr:phenylacetate-CoA oxygenase subunit PaaJ [Verrucomicrobiota bacterium]
MNASLPSLEEIWVWLDSVSDPEIPVLSVVDLGIVRDVRWAEEDPDFTEQTSPRVNRTSVTDGRLRQPRTQRAQRSEPTLVVTVTPTYSGCPAMAVVKHDIQRELLQRGLSRVSLETQISPAWTTDWMTERGRKRLHEYGIAPPEPQAANPSTLIPCPRCGSSDTRLVSRFGSTPCKAFYICNSCLEPFDHFKCH